MTNDSKVLIYLSMLFLLLKDLKNSILVRNARGKVANSNKSELWNHLSYRGLPYLEHPLTSTTLTYQSENLKNKNIM